MWRSSGKGSTQGRAGLLDSLGRRGALLRRRWKGQRDQSITGGEQLLEDSLTCGGSWREILRAQGLGSANASSEAFLESTWGFCAAPVCWGGVMWRSSDGAVARHGGGLGLGRRRWGDWDAGVRGVLIKGRRVTWACAPAVGRPARSGPGISASVARGRQSWRAGPTGQRWEERGDARAVSEGWLTCGPRWSAG
jgi:hypothetical protein